MRIAALLALLTLAGCGRDLPPTPAAARAQDPLALPFVPHRASGRLAIDAPGKRLSVEFLLRRDAPGRARAVLLEDTGVILADVAIGDGAPVVHRVVDDLRPRLGLITDLLRAAYGAAPPTARGWEDGALRIASADGVRWYAGDPLLPRLVEGTGWPVRLEDWRWVAGMPVAWRITADRTVATVVITLREVRPLAR